MNYVSVFEVGRDGYPQPGSGRWRSTDTRAVSSPMPWDEEPSQSELEDAYGVTLGPFVTDGHDYVYPIIKENS